MRDHKNYHILAIEDNKADAALIKIYLEDAALPSKVLEASSLEAGIQAVFNNNVDLVLLDLTLPDSDRFATLKRFLEEAPDVPVIVMTGYKDDIMGIQAVRAGAQDFLVKGEFDGKDLVKSIKYSLQRFNRQNKLRETANALSIHQHHYQVVHQMAKFGNWDMDIVSYAMKWPDEMFRILGLQTQSFQPTLRDYLNLVHVEDRKQVERFFEMAVKDGEIHRLKHRVLINNRTIKHIALQARVNYDELREKILLIGSIQDITEHRTSKKNLISEPETPPTPSIQEKIIKQVSERQLAHLSAILEQCNTLSKKNNYLGSQKDQFRRIAPNLVDLLYSISRLHNLAELSSGYLLRTEEKQFSVKSLFNKINLLTELIQYHNGNIIRLQFEANLPERVVSDFEKIHHLFINLLCLTQLPASRYIHFDLYVSSREIEEDVAIFHIIVNCKGNPPSLEKVESLIESENVLELLVNDQKNEWQYALAIIGKITKALKGISQFRDKAGKGRQIELEFPVKTMQETKDYSMSKIEGPLNVLLVEDHSINQIATKRMLTSWSDDIKVDVAANGEKGVQMFKELKYDIVLMDLKMPVMNGLEAARAIRSLSDTPIIALTPNASREEEESCYAIGMNDYLLKPFKPQDLYAKISKLVRRN